LPDRARNKATLLEALQSGPIASEIAADVEKNRTFIRRRMIPRDE
jgi:hypothetical protein